ncbi:MAG: potassium transporter Kup [Myxococcaceae bacterium]|nr:potassium transporter Kup [Myxococcaceae bacterium]
MSQDASPPSAPTAATASPAGQKEGSPEEGSRRAGHVRQPLATLALSALGIVYGDIGTSPLYALKECFHGPHAVAATPGNVMGVLSLVFWSLIIVISLKYLAWVMRADNRGEGGILALMALVLRKTPVGARQGRFVVIALGLFGAALLYGDGIITPAISVLSAVEGLSIATHVFDDYVLLICIVILVALFLMQRRGTAGVGALFGPVTLVWFIVLAVLGVSSIVQTPGVLASINPAFGYAFFRDNGWHGFLILGAVFLCVTGGEALYADMGHFGPRPIRTAWFSVVLPALVLNYLGQGALLLRNPGATEHPFYRVAPDWALFPLVALATAATVIASQAVISGAFSVTRQAMQLGYIPRVNIIHTSAQEIGQVYIPAINWLLLLAVIGLVLGFRTSSNLAAAYGIAVTSTMVVTTVLAYIVSREQWGWPMVPMLLFTVPLLVVDSSFFLSNAVKILDGGWFPLVVALGVFVLMTTWKRGRQILADRLREGVFPLDLFLEGLKTNPPPRTSGTAVFMTGSTEGTPVALLHNLKHNKVLHERVVFLTVMPEEVSHVAPSERIEVEELAEGVWRVVVRHGFMESMEMPTIMALARAQGLDLKLMETSFFLGRETLIPTGRPGMARWREGLFAIMSRNARPATAFFRIPPNRVVELGAQIEL